MSEEVVTETTALPDAAPDNAAALPETDATKAPENAGATGAPENVEVETDEQKNERVQREAEADRQKRAEKQSRGVQKRIDELTADKHAERKRADELAALLKQTLEQGKPGQVAKPTGMPTREQYPDLSYEEFIDLRTEYVAEQRARAIVEESSKAQREAQAKITAEQSAREMQRNYAAREAEVVKSHPDYREVMDESDVSVPQGVLESIKLMEDGPLIAYHLAKQPELAQQFWDKPQALHGIILGQLSATLKATAPKVSNAPSPGKGVGTKPAANNGPPSDPEQYFAWANKHLK